MVEWFKEKFPRAERRYGPPLLISGEPNHDAWAYALREGSARVVFCPAEAQFYYLDRLVDAYRPVDPEERLMALVRALVRKASANLSFQDARQFCSLWSEPHVCMVVSRAKALLSVEPEFFSAPNGMKRIEPVANISHKMFAEQLVELQQGAVLTAPDAYQGYFIFCRQNQAIPLRRTQFKQKFTDETLARWGIGMRNDLVVPRKNNEKPTICQGWQGLGLRALAGMN